MSSVRHIKVVVHSRARIGLCKQLNLAEGLAPLLLRSATALCSSADETRTAFDERTSVSLPGKGVASKK